MSEQEPLIEFGGESAEADQTPLEKKYNQQMRQIVSQKIDLPISTLPEMIKRLPGSSLKVSGPRNS